MQESAASDLRIAKLERQVRLLTFGSLAALDRGRATFVISMRTTSVSANEAAHILHTHGIVIEDDHGHPPFCWVLPFRGSKDESAATISTNGIVLLEETGADRLIMGMLSLRKWRKCGTRTKD